MLVWVECLRFFLLALVAWHVLYCASVFNWGFGVSFNLGELVDVLISNFQFSFSTSSGVLFVFFFPSLTC